MSKPIFHLRFWCNQPNRLCLLDYETMIDSEVLVTVCDKMVSAYIQWEDRNSEALEDQLEGQLKEEIVQ